jgi:3-oxoacyl-[acyl-carrier protein] reductase
MDLGLRGRKAIVCASSRGLGRACAAALAAEGVAVVMNGRHAETLDAAADAVRAASGVEVKTVLGNVSDPKVQDALIAACPEPDILVNNNGGPGLGDFRALDRAAMEQAALGNMITPIEMVQRVIDGMMARGFGRIVNITSATVKLPLPGLDISSAARAGLTAFLAGPARQVAAARNVTINHILPGIFATDRFMETGGDSDPARVASVPAKRAGVPDELGRLCAYLCSVHAGYIVGQSIVIDGGRYPGVL